LGLPWQRAFTQAGISNHILLIGWWHFGEGVTQLSDSRRNTNNVNFEASSLPAQRSADSARTTTEAVAGAIAPMPLSAPRPSLGLNATQSSFWNTTTNPTSRKPVTDPRRTYILAKNHISHALCCRWVGGCVPKGALGWALRPEAKAVVLTKALVPMGPPTASVVLRAESASVGPAENWLRKLTLLVLPLESESWVTPSPKATSMTEDMVADAGLGKAPLPRQAQWRLFGVSYLGVF